MRVVVVDEELPYPANSGKRLRTINLISRLACWHKITYLSHRNPNSQEQLLAEEFLRDHGVEVVPVAKSIAVKSGAPFYWALAKNLLSKMPYSVQSHMSHALCSAIRSLSAREHVDLWHVEWTPYAHFVHGAVKAPWVVMAHNVESQIWMRYYQNEPNPLKRWYIGQQWKKFHRFEKWALNEATRTIVVSEADADLARSWFSVEQPLVVSNGVDLDYFLPVAQLRKPSNVLFLGSLDWRPNQDAVRFLLDRVWPGLRSSLPDIRLSIVGRRPPAWMGDAIRRLDGVELHADVPDVRPYLAAAYALVVPLRIGGGSRLKILEAAASGVPVVSTAVGAEGLSLVPNRHYLQAETAEETVRAVSNVINDRATATRLTDAARQHVVEQYGWDACAGRLDAIWHACARAAVVEEAVP